MPKPYAELFKRGIAVGYAKIHDDTIEFQFRGEHFAIPTLECHHYSHYNGYFYEAKASLVKKSAQKLKEMKNG